MDGTAAPLALVLSGGGARGAYELGVLKFAFGTLLPKLGPRARPRIFCGTSVGAINACALAAHVQRDDLGIPLLAERWLSLKLDDVFRVRWGDLAGLAAWLFGRERAGGPTSLLDASPLAHIVRTVIPWRALHENVAARRVDGVCVSATDVETGHGVVFCETELNRNFGSRDAALEWACVRLTAQHALASAAIPIIFPAVRVAGRVYSDGSLRQNTPIAPALRLGAERVLVIGLRTRRAAEARPAGLRARQDPTDQRAYASPLYLFGKVLNALLLDRVENDLANLRQVNAALAALRDFDFGAAHAAPVAAALEAAGGGMRPVSDFFIRPSRDLGALAVDVLRRSTVRARLNGPAGYLLRKLADSPDPSDMVSYLLFDGDYVRELIALGEEDARANAAQLEAFLTEAGTSATQTIRSPVTG